LRDAGAHLVVLLPADATVLSIPAEQFVRDVLRAKMGVRVVVGENFRFGHRASGSVLTLRQLSSVEGLDGVEVGMVEVGPTRLSAPGLPVAGRPGLAPPRQPWHLRAFAHFSSADHLGTPRLPIKNNIENNVALNGIQLGDRGRVLMLANARVLGHVFDPLSVFWCYDSDAVLVCVVAEVHNTYGERHAYLLRPDKAGVAVTDKDFHVSPFFDVSGTYELRFTLRPDLVSSTVTLRRQGAVAFSATFQGRPELATRPALARRLIRQPLMPQRISALIRVHGIWLWLHRLPVRPQPHHIRQEGVSP
jgi:DUF1365 family protein